MIVDITRKVPEGDKLYEWYRTVTISSADGSVAEEVESDANEDSVVAVAGLGSRVWRSRPRRLSRRITRSRPSSTRTSR